MSDITIRSARNILGSIRFPGDKSISHRYAMLAALAEGVSRFSNSASLEIFCSRPEVAATDAETWTRSSSFISGFQ